MLSLRRAKSPARGARDSVEAIDRVTVGLKSAGEYKSLGAKSPTRFEFMEGSVAGGLGYYTANPDGDELRVVPFPQVWFAKSAKGHMIMSGRACIRGMRIPVSIGVGQLGAPRSSRFCRITRISKRPTSARPCNTPLG